MTPESLITFAINVLVAVAVIFFVIYALIGLYQIIFRGKEGKKNGLKKISIGVASISGIIILYTVISSILTYLGHCPLSGCMIIPF